MTDVNASRWTQLRARFSDRARWKQSLFDLALWFMFGIAVTQGLAMYSPGYPILVGTPSIPTGLYWVDTTSAGHAFKQGDYVSFPVHFQQKWLRDRYGDDLVHTKIALGLPGDKVSSDTTGKLTVCSPNGSCKDAGAPLAQDSKGRPLQAWMPPLHEYTIRPGEVWVHGTHVRSLDSRYHGPVPADHIKGKATQLWLFDLG